MSIWIALASFYVCWCSSATSSHPRETLSYSMYSWHHDGGSMAKIISLDDDEEHIQNVLTKF